MNMWAVSGLPVYTVSDTRPKSKGVKGKTKKKLLSLEGPQGLAAPPPLRPLPLSDASRQETSSIDHLLDHPAFDGPPSPENIRDLSNKLRRASINDRQHEKHRGHHASSSASSSLRSLTSADKPLWEIGQEGTLSRKSSGRSGRSASSAMPSKDRPDSVQIFGKTIFNRRPKLRRESSAQSSAASSIYSTDAATDGPSQTLNSGRESTIPALFGIRRGSRQEQGGEGRERKLTISGPYNFQHIAHTDREQVQALDGPSANYTQLRTAPAPVSCPSQSSDMHFAGFSSDNLAVNDDATAAEMQVKAITSLSRAPSVLKKNPPRRLHRAMSQEQFGVTVPPPRPPRSPVEPSCPSMAPSVPPRGSSRTSLRHERFDSIDYSSRPQTSTGFRGTQPFPAYVDTTSPPATSYGYAPGPDMDVIPEHGYSHVTSPPADDTNWPLPCSSEYTLPGVPEEDEASFGGKKSTGDSGNGTSSLRSSQSVPMLRAFSTLQDDSCRNSQGSDTLGKFDLFSAQQALRAALMESKCDTLPREDWEDDIDYCYEHACEADCDYEWSRPSFEMERDGDNATPVDGSQGRKGAVEEGSPHMLTPGQFDVPALSPASQISSAATAHEAITPAPLSNAKVSNFSLPRTDVSKNPHVRKSSDASSFKESHGFTLSPSLLIPMDFQHHMMAYEAERREAAGFPTDFRGHYNDDELSHLASSSMDPSAMMARYRTSASTVGSSTNSAFFEAEDINNSSSSSKDKHYSTASTVSTDYTRLSASIASLDIDAHKQQQQQQQQQQQAAEPFPAFDANMPMPSVPETTEAAPPPPSFSRALHRTGFRHRGSESNLRRLAATITSNSSSDEPMPKAKVTVPPPSSLQQALRRGRARTTSLSTPPPPGQYSLFPSVVKETGMGNGLLGRMI
ncbi:uncharacterized protein CTHT_0023880 [Thermochaetoides thermophila DSM 1495]|uniref:CRIB domain-containing protein n=1 Tax=Chaetomium thermophilum (strain DSM 1495 / CBS 144.50 / IMI 039719) TaxID=759272 RepID=G0S529_CHATD|nr:hypothetical protein CTHT_0023880 [Thermochaetoides thermophila DSM 1495]EGS20554.1 hypothetical protein CTHT_0023880 [Thermochaetoides thermophila DSM 1495]